MADKLADILGGPVEEVAPRLLGCELVRELDGRLVRARIVEVEAYSQDDVASHSYHGETPRTKVMFGPPGFLYVYFTYGMHYCCNIVTGPSGHGSAVLLRALEPLEGEDVLAIRRNGRTGIELTNGPAKLCQALDINREWNGHDLRQAPLRLEIRPPAAQTDIVQTTRIGISRAKDVPWRFYLKGNPYVSKL
jgi:DNA-3-methyladenine glycosylase